MSPREVLNVAEYCLLGSIVIEGAEEYSLGMVKKSIHAFAAEQNNTNPERPTSNEAKNEPGEPPGNRKIEHRSHSAAGYSRKIGGRRPPLQPILASAFDTNASTTERARLMHRNR